MLLKLPPTWIPLAWEFYWHLLTEVIVPLFAAAIAASVIALQIRKGTIERVEDRRLLAYQAAVDLVVQIVDDMFDEAGRPARDQFRTNRQLARVNSGFRGKDEPLALWVIAQTKLMHAMVQDFIKNPDQPSKPGRVTQKQVDVNHEGVVVMQVLQDWLEGKRNISWFKQNMPRAFKPDASTE